MISGDIVTLPNGAGEHVIDRIVWTRGICGSQLVVLVWRGGGSLRCLAGHQLPVTRP